MEKVTANELKLINIDNTLTNVSTDLIDLMTLKFGSIINDANNVYRKSVNLRFDGSQPSLDDKAQAKDLIKELVKVRRINKNTKDDLKREAIDYNSAVQGVFNYIQSTVESFENQLKNITDWDEIEKIRLTDLLKSERLNEIGVYIAFFNKTVLENLGNLSDDDFKNQLDLAVMLSKKAESDALETARLAKETQESMRLMQEELAQTRELKLKAESDAHVAKQREEAAIKEAQALLDKENAALSAAAAELEKKSNANDFEKIEFLKKDVVNLFNACVLESNLLEKRKEAILIKIINALDAFN